MNTNTVTSSRHKWPYKCKSISVYVYIYIYTYIYTHINIAFQHMHTHAPNTHTHTHSWKACAVYRKPATRRLRDGITCQEACICVIYYGQCAVSVVYVAVSSVYVCMYECMYITYALGRLCVNFSITRFFSSNICMYISMYVFMYASDCVCMLNNRRSHTM